MANKRILKKNITTVCSNLAVEIARAAHYDSRFSPEKVRDIILNIAKLQAEALSRCSFSFDKTPRDFASRREYNKARKLYNEQAYEKLRTDFNKAVDTIVKAMNEARPKKD